MHIHMRFKMVWIVHATHLELHVIGGRSSEAERMPSSAQRRSRVGLSRSSEMGQEHDSRVKSCVVVVDKQDTYARGRLESD